MVFHSLVAWCIYALYIPVLIIALISADYVVRRAVWRRRKRQGKGDPGFCPSVYDMGATLEFLQVFYRPSMAYVQEAKHEADENADQDDNGDPNSPQARLRHFHRQLRRIRHGKPVDTLQWRL